MDGNDKSLDCLLNPQSIAIIGASDNPDKIGGRPIHYMRKHSYGGVLYPINPQRSTVQGEHCWPALGELPKVPDLAIVAVPGQDAVAAVDACAAMGVGAAIVIAAGFSETGEQGRVIQDGMTARARRAGMRIVGPNSQGLANFGNGAIACFSTMFLEIAPKDGPVAVISQSGGMAAMLYGMLRQRGVGVRHVHATGNEADVTVSELACAVMRDPEIRVVLLYLESLQDPGVLAEAARLAREGGVCLAVVKAGRSGAGARAAGSHTGALASEDRVVDAFLAHHGILRASDPQELARYAELMLASPPPQGRRVVIVSNSGASCVLASDAAEACHLEVAPLADETRAQLGQRLSSFATTDNPVDITAALLSDNRLFGDVLSVIGKDAAADMFVLDIPVAGRGYDVASFAQDAAAFALAARKPVVVVAWQQPVAHAFREQGVPVYDDEQQAMAALAAMARLGEMRRSSPAHWPDASEVLAPRSDHRFLSESESLDLLAQHDIPVVRHVLCQDVESALAAWGEVGGPCVIKACSALLPHKSEHGLVDIGLNDEAAIRASVQRQSAVLHALGVAHDGWLVAPQVPALQEMALGMTLDPVFGPVVLIGAGGKYVESMPDVALLLPPFQESEVLAALRSLRIWPVLQGVRGEPAADLPALVSTAIAFGKLARATAGCFGAMDINPLRVRAVGEGLLAVDALVELATADSISALRPEVLQTA